MKRYVVFWNHASQQILTRSYDDNYGAIKRRCGNLVTFWPGIIISKNQFDALISLKRDGTLNFSELQLVLARNF